MSRQSEQGWVPRPWQILLRRAGWSRHGRDGRASDTLSDREKLWTVVYVASKESMKGQGRSTFGRVLGDPPDASAN